jgi:flagellar hook assembly protein FlgD
MDWNTGKMTAAPKSYGLFQNYPNPFNPITTVAYQVPETGRVRVAVFNSRGEILKVLADGTREAGYYTVIWDGRRGDGMQAPSGIYFIRMQAGSYSKVQKAMLLR